MIQMIIVDSNAGTVTEKVDFISDIPNGQDCWTLLLTHTPVLFYVEGEEVEYPPNCLVLYEPHQKIYYRSVNGHFLNDWVRFYADSGDISSSVLPTGIPVPVAFAGQCHELFNILCVENWVHNKYREANVDYLIRLLLNKLVESWKKETPPYKYQNLVELRMEVYRFPNRQWTTGMMADKLHVSPSYMQTLYRKLFNISCMDDVIKSRIQMAKDKLTYTELSISKIAEVCGYNNTEHFCRQFKKRMELSPGEYRKAILDKEKSWIEKVEMVNEVPNI